MLREQEVAWSTGGFGGALDDTDHFGHALAALGDLDGDGVGDLAVGAPDDDDGGINRGAVWILFMEPAGTVRDQAKLSAAPGSLPGMLRNGDRFGSALATLGDVDGDGRPELAVGAELDDDGGTNRGAVWLVSLEPTGAAFAARKLSQTSGGLGALADRGEFGCALAALDDLDGDGRLELAVGARADATGGLGRGAVWVLFLDATGAVARRTKIASASGAFTGQLDDEDQFGSAVAALPDLDGDGLPELAVGAAQDDDGAMNCGAVWLLSLNADASVRSQSKVSRASGLALVQQDRFGASLAAIGDVDGNGTCDLAAGAPLDDGGGLNSGALWMLLLEPDGSLRGHALIGAASGGLATPPSPGDQLGVGLAGLGDLDGDRMLDLAVGLENEDIGGRDRGSFRVLFLHTAELLTLVVRNGLGLNPVILSASDAPVVGKTWEPSVDCKTFRRGVILLIVGAQPYDGPRLGRLGQLLVDWRQPAYALAHARHFGAPTKLAVPVPADPRLAGLDFSSQAFVTGGPKGARLTNALDGKVRAR